MALALYLERVGFQKQKVALILRHNFTLHIAREWATESWQLATNSINDAIPSTIVWLDIYVPFARYFRSERSTLFWCWPALQELSATQNRFLFLLAMYNSDSVNGQLYLSLLTAQSYGSSGTLPPLHHPQASGLVPDLRTFEVQRRRQGRRHNRWFCDHTRDVSSHQRLANLSDVLQYIDGHDYYLRHRYVIYEGFEVFGRFLRRLFRCLRRAGLPLLLLADAGAKRCHLCPTLRWSKYVPHLLQGLYILIHCLLALPRHAVGQFWIQIQTLKLRRESRR